MSEDVQLSGVVLSITNSCHGRTSFSFSLLMRFSHGHLSSMINHHCRKFLFQRHMGSNFSKFTEDFIAEFSFEK